MEKALVIPPKDLRKNIKDLLRIKLLRLVEGSCSRRYGYIVAVTNIDEEHSAQGRIIEGTGDVVFPMKYNAIVFKPFRNEVIDALVTDAVTKEGFFAKAGPLEIFISYKNMPSDMKFDDTAVPPLFIGDGLVKIQKDTCVRVKILNTRIDADGMVCAASEPPPVCFSSAHYEPAKCCIKGLCSLSFACAPSLRRRLLALCPTCVLFFIMRVQHAVGTFKEDYLGVL